MWVNFDELPLQSRVWVFQSNRMMSPDEQSSIDDAVKHFVQKWSTHGVQMLASHILFHNCFVVIAADEQKQAASGCSIDSFTALFKAFGTQYNLSFFDRMPNLTLFPEGSPKGFTAGCLIHRIFACQKLLPASAHVLRQKNTQKIEK